MSVKRSLSITGRIAAACRRYLRNQKGVAAIEFGFIAAPFLYLLCGILEIGAMFLAQVMLDHGAMEASRRIRTMELQSSGGSASDFKKIVCDNTFGMLNCASRMYVDVNTFENFNSISQNPPITNNALDQNQLNFVPGVAGNIVVARVFYEWKILTPFFGAIWGNLGGNQRLLESAVAFRNEPS